MTFKEDKETLYHHLEELTDAEVLLHALDNIIDMLEKTYKNIGIHPANIDEYMKEEGDSPV